MPPAGTTPGLDEGIRAEIRVAQTWFWDGYYVRRGIDLQNRFGSGVSTVTDLDILGYSFDPSLAYHKRIGEVKSGKAKQTPRPLDRALWISGLRQLVNAESGEITTAFPTTAPIRDICGRLSVTIQHLDDLDARELRLQIANFDDLGSQGNTVVLLRKDVHDFAKSDQRLERAYWFLVSEIWFLESFDAVKRTLGLIRELAKEWPPDSHATAVQAYRWFFAEAISILTLNLAIIAGEANSMDPGTFREMAAARLASGDLPSYAIASLSERFDEYLGKILASLNAPPELITNSIGAFWPTPPDYTEPLLELISRLAAQASVTALLPRQLDAILFERLVRRRNLSPALLGRLGIDRRTERQIRTIAAFLRGQFRIPDIVDRVLTTALTETSSDRVLAATQTLLFQDRRGNASGSGLSHGEEQPKPDDPPGETQLVPPAPGPVEQNETEPASE